jgi:valyl-tRNA synthetase
MKDHEREPIGYTCPKIDQFIKNIKKSVTEAFIRLFERDLIYRDLRPINWCCSLKSALSDAEVNQNKFTKLFITHIIPLIIYHYTYIIR